MAQSDPLLPTIRYDQHLAENAAGGAERPVPQCIGRYRVQQLLGRGGFGLVYLARDDQLERHVAVKVPHERHVTQAADAEAYLIEARMTAHLDHPHIVPVFDVGGTEQFPCFVVSKYIDGTDLATRLRRSRFSFAQAVELVATVADALHHAHEQEIVHRDVKPGNILLNKSGQPFVSDFGLALREEDVGTGPRYVGTPAYMSPEQARGEGHRVDGRSDIFGLGVVFYELLVGSRPFGADSREELLEQICSIEAKPPRHLDGTIPKEIDRICLKALCKRASERYSTARDFAEDLRQCLVDLPSGGKSLVASHSKSAFGIESAVRTSTISPDVRIIPRGLRSFDAADADFLLELLPGPRDREGLPDSIRFWKTRIESTDPDATFSVGLIYGPSGCGKSSLVKAGLLPRLADAVTRVYIEASAEETEARLLRGLQRQVPDLPSELGLAESLAAVRRGGLPGQGRKLLLVIDQFEQWLHARQSEAQAELVQALRQCDGVRVQCIVMVRDDFWLSVSRFMQSLEVPVVEGENARLADLFDPRHARKVLAAFGRAYGALSEGVLTKQQEAFLDQAIDGLTQAGKVVSVRLALFAEMVKGKPWTPATLKEVGGTEGVGVTFLEETFTASTAPPQHRLHQRAAQAVLKAMLPEAGMAIKGHMRSQQELRDASGYAGRPRDFGDLLRILDSEVRVITPTDPEARDDASSSPTSSGEKYYQLTHDYLVPALRDWLTRKQKETRRGRAEIRLEESAALLQSSRDRYLLPSLWEWLSFGLLTRRRNWTDAQRRMMQMAARRHLLRIVAAVLLVGVLSWWGITTRERMKAESLISSLKSATITEVPHLADEISNLRGRAATLLRNAYGQSPDSSRERLHFGLALVADDPTQVDYLLERSLQADPMALTVIRDALDRYAEQIADRLWECLENDNRDESQRFRAAQMLAGNAPATLRDEARWRTVVAFVADRLVGEAMNDPASYASLVELLRPVRGLLGGPLGEVFRSTDSPARRIMATNILADYLADDAVGLADLVLDSDPAQYAKLFPLLEKFPDRAAVQMSAALHATVAVSAADSEPERSAKEPSARRAANAAVTLLRLNRPDEVWPLFRHSPDPRVRTHLIYRVEHYGVDPLAIARRLDIEADVSAKRALLLALGEFTSRSPDWRESLRPRLQSWFLSEPDAGIHSAVEWLLQTWGWPVPDPGLANGERNWNINSEGHVMAVVDASSTPAIGRKFEIATREVTVEQLRRFRPGHYSNLATAPTNDCPANVVIWFTAVAYCQWLSEREGVPEQDWCYPPLRKLEDDPAMELWKIPAVDLTRTGYRLPTMDEWEFACGAGAVTSRYYGEDNELLAKYAWYFENSKENSKVRSWPVGRLKPNDFGLFDMLGNIGEWSGDRYGDRPGDRTDDKVHVWMAGSGTYKGTADDLHTVAPDYALPRTEWNSYGFRIARTHPAKSPRP